MRICLLADIASIHTRRWVDATIAAGYDVLVLSPQPFPNKYPQTLVYEKTSPKNVQIRLWRRFLKVINSVYLLTHYFNVRVFLHHWRDIWDISRGLGTHPGDIEKMKREIRDFNPDLIHVHNINIPLYQWLIIKDFPKVKVVVTVWGDDIEEQTFKHSSLSRKLKKLILQRADIVTAASNKLASLTKRYAPIQKVEIVPFGIDLNKFRPRLVRPGKRVTIGTIRHLRVTYGIDLIIKAAAMLKAENWEVVIAGDGNQVPYKKLAVELGIGKKVKFLGEVEYSKVPEVLKKLDIFMMPSRWEGFGVAAVEAGASGIPVVGTRVGGIPEVVKDGFSGILVPREDAKALAVAIDRLIGNSELIAQLSANAPKFVAAHFDWEKNTRQMFSLYEKLVKHAQK